MATLSLAHSVPISTKGKKSLGMNPHQILPFTPFRFINICKHAQWWVYGGTNTEIDVSEIDGNGYPNIDGTFDAAICQSASTQPDRAGIYKVTWDGTGTVSVRGSEVVGSPVSSSTSGFTFHMTEATFNPVVLAITQSGGNRVTNIAVVRQAGTSSDPGGEHPGHESLYRDDGEVLIPEIKTEMEKYDTIRFFWWCGAHWIDGDDFAGSLPFDGWTWKTRFDDYSRPTTKKLGVPYSVMISASNDAQANPWINIPYEATDDYITALATLVRDNLDPGLIPKWEYANEAWLDTFSAYQCRRGAWADGWSASASETYLPYVTDFSGWTAVGCTIGGDGVTITEDTSTGEHYIEKTLTYSAGSYRILLMLLEAATAPGVRLYMTDGSNTIDTKFNLGTNTVASSSGHTGYDGPMIRDKGDYRALWTTGTQSNGASRTVRIQFTDASFATSYTGTSKTLTLKRAGVFHEFAGIHQSWYVKRATQMRDLVGAVFWNRPFRTILAWQASAGGSAATALLEASDWEANDGVWDENPRTYAHGSLHDILSCATYFGNYNMVGDSSGIGGVFCLPYCNAMWAAYDAAGGDAAMPTSGQAIKDLILRDTGGGVMAGYLADQATQVKSYISQYAAVAKANGMSFQTYEGGNHSLFGRTDTDLHSGGSLKPNIGTIVKEIMYSDEAATLWGQVLDHWKAAGGDTWDNLTDIMFGSSATDAGYFGLRNYTGETNPVATAVETWFNDNPRWWVN